MKLEHIGVSRGCLEQPETNNFWRVAFDDSQWIIIVKLIGNIIRIGPCHIKGRGIPVATTLGLYHHKDTHLKWLDLFFHSLSSYNIEQHSAIIGELICKVKIHNKN